MSASDEWLEGWPAIAAHIRVSAKSAQRFAKRDDPLPTVKFRHRVRANVGALDEWVRRNTVHVSHG